MNKTFGSLNHWLYLYKADEVLWRAYIIDSGPAVSPTCNDEPVVLYEDDKNTVSTSGEDNNNKHLRKIEN